MIVAVGVVFVVVIRLATCSAACSRRFALVVLLFFLLHTCTVLMVGIGEEILLIEEGVCGRETTGI